MSERNSLEQKEDNLNCMLCLKMVNQSDIFQNKKVIGNGKNYHRKHLICQYSRENVMCSQASRNNSFLIKSNFPSLYNTK